MKKLALLLLALTLVLALCACGSGEDVVFRNDLDSKIHSVYISPISDEEWSDPLNYAILNVGSSIHIDFEKFSGDSAYYDVAAVDENNMNYDIYDVPLSIGDTLAMSADGETAILTVTSADGSTNTYEGYAYNADDVED